MPKEDRLGLWREQWDRVLIVVQSTMNARVLGDVRIRLDRRPVSTPRQKGGKELKIVRKPACIVGDREHTKHSPHRKVNVVVDHLTHLWRSGVRTG